MGTIMQMSKPVYCLIFFILIIEWMSLSEAKAGGWVDVRNVKYEMTEKQIVITYDLLGTPDTEYKVTITLKRRQMSSFEYTPRSISGDFGQGKFSGKGRQIIWDFLRDFPQGLEGDDYYFEVEAEILSSESETGTRIGIFGGLALPGSDFGSSDPNNSEPGSALLGFGGGIECNVPLASSLGWVTSLSVIYNDVDPKIMKEIAEIVASEDSYTYNGVDYTPWLTWWLMTGLRASIPVTPIYAQVQLGACFAKAPDYTLKYSEGNVDMTSDPVTGLGFSAGAGVGFGSFKIFARYMHASDLEFERRFSAGGASSSVNGKQTIDIILVTAGIEF